MFGYINNLPHNFVADFVFLLVHNLTKEGLVYFIAAVFLLLLKRQVFLNLVSLSAVSGFATYLLNDWVLKNIFQRSRPFEVLADVNYIPPAPDSFSMPSGQAAVAAAIAVMAFLVVPNKKFAATFSAFAALVMLDRVYLGHHYPADVLAGAAVGMVVSLLVFKFRKSIFSAGKSLRFKK